MLLKRKRGWEIPEREATPASLFWRRRELMAALAAGPILFKSGLAGAAEGEADPTADLYPAPRNEGYALDRPLTDRELVEGYNNFYEFGSHKEIARAARALKLRPWEVRIDGMVEEERTVDIDTLIRAMPLEERLYRLRCVEAWSLTVPWTGFPMRALVDYARPLGSAKYVRMETFTDARVAPGQKQFWYPWPYVEGLTMAEARNELAFMVTGAYGAPVAKQNGAPIRLMVPWKYGFKSAKSLVRFTFTDERPVGFWEELQASEYGFWANVNPDVPHPRWSQKTERVLGTDERVPTKIFNGYGEFVADLYKGLEGERLFA
jgi:methionine sulfoxide reductase catalytic subunit